MVVEKVGIIQATYFNNKVKKYKDTQRTSTTNNKDNIQISSKAKDALELSKIVNKIVAKGTLTKAEKIADIKNRIANGTYFTDEVTNKVAESIANILI